MKKGQRLWSRDEIILAINLYCKTPFGRLHRGNQEVIELSKLINRTPSSVAYKLVNLASLDPNLQKRGIRGMSNASKLDKQVWNEFYQNWETVTFESEKLRAKFEGKSIEELIIKNEELSSLKTTEKEAFVKQRVKQDFFRKMILASYNDTCCITGIKKRELLVAGHIKPWALDLKNRLNPQNGIAINYLHDRAFEIGLITIDSKFKIKVASEILKSKDVYLKKQFSQYHKKDIFLPSKFLPDPIFLEYHNSEKFRG